MSLHRFTLLHSITLTLLASMCLASNSSTTSARSSGETMRDDNPPTVGDAPPPLTFSDSIQVPEGNELTWESLRGNVVVLEFWATWCVPCVAAIPHLNELAETFAEEPVRFLSATNQARPLVERFLNARAMKSGILLDTEGAWTQAYGRDAIPFTVIVGRDGKIAAITRPEYVTADTLRKLIAGKPAGIPVENQPIPVPQVAGLDPNAEAGDKVPAYQASIYRLKEQPGRRASSWGDGKFTSTGLDVRMALIAGSFNRVPPEHIFGSEEVLSGTFIDCVILSPDGKAESARAMLHEALERTLGVTIRIEQRMMPVVVLRKGEGMEQKMKRVDDDVKGGRITDTPGVYTGIGEPIWMIRNILDSPHNSTRLFNPPVPLIDEIGVTGRFDFELRWDPENPESLFKSMPRNLGITMTREDRMMEVLVVEPK